MFAAVTQLLIFLAFAAIHVRADPDPTTPGPGDVFIQGKSCTIGWNVDPTGVWKTMHIDLMTGDNFDMVFLASVATVDGTNPSKNTFSFTCPQVTPHSAIYFYQFSSPSTPNKTWTGRFAITDSANNVVAPSMSTQPDGSKIPWGTGSLVGSSSSGSSTVSSTALVTASSIAPSSASVSSSVSSSASASYSASASVPASASETSTPTAVNATSVVFVTPSAVAGSGTNGAATSFSTSNIIFQTGLALGLAAFIVTF